MPLELGPMLSGPMWIMLASIIMILNAEATALAGRSVQTDVGRPAGVKDKEPGVLGATGSGLDSEMWTTAYSERVSFRPAMLIDRISVLLRTSLCFALCKSRPE